MAGHRVRPGQKGGELTYDRRMDPDDRYARGEIPRDEWMRLRGAAAATPPPPPAVSPSALQVIGGHRTLLLVAVVLVAAVAVAAALFYSLGNSSVGAWSPSYGSVRTLSASDLSALNASASRGTAFSGNDTLWFHGISVNLVVYMSPPAHDMAFMVQGIANPTIHVPTGARVTVTAVNMDPDMYHNWALTRIAPPYGSMPMMSSGSMISMAMLSPPSGSGYWSQEMSFTAVSGSYWYLCEYAGHAADGMYGAFVAGD